MEFPEEIWQLILNHFEPVHLKACLLWSQDFRELVIKTPTLMRRLPVFFNRNTAWEETLLFVKNYGQFVKIVKFESCNFKDVFEVEKILRMIPNVEEVFCNNENIWLTEDNGNITENNDENLENDQQLTETIKNIKLDDFKLQKLKILAVCGFSEFSEKLLKALSESSKNLESFKLHLRYEEPLSRYFEDFIVNLHHLNNLELIGYYDTAAILDAIFTESFLKNCKFKLTSLNVECGLQYKERFSRFLLKQSKTIKNLTLTYFNVNFHYFRLVFNNFHNLEKLSLSISPLLNDTRAEEVENIRMPSVKQLDLPDCCEDVGVFKRIINIFPNLEALSMDLTYFSLRGILEKLPKLKKLSLTPVRLHLLTLARNDGLKELNLGHIHAIFNPIFMEKLAEDLPNIEKLVMKNVEFVSFEIAVKKDIEIILGSLKLFKKLKTFKLINDESRTVSASEDADYHEPLSMLINNNFSLEISTFKDQKMMKASEYFIENHSELIEKLKSDLNLKLLN